MNARTVVSAFTGLLLIACTPSPMPNAEVIGTQNQSAAVLVQRLQQQGESNVSVIEIGKQPGASFAMSFRIGGAEDFSIKASTSGSLAKTSADISSFKVYLLEDTTAPSGDIGSKVVAGPVSVSANLSGSNQTFVFSNVAANSASKKYYVGLQAFDASNANLTASTGKTVGSAAVALSNAGGDGLGGVQVNADLSITGGQEGRLNVLLPLLNATGASLDSQVTVQNGSSSIGPVSITSP